MSQMDLHDQFLQNLAPPTANATEPTAPPEKLLQQLYTLPRRARLPRLSPRQKRDLARHVAKDQQGLTLECIAFLRRLQQARYPRKPQVTAEPLQTALAKEQQALRLSEGAGRLGRAATDGALVANGVLATLNNRVLGHVRGALPGLPAAEQDLLRSIWDPVVSLLDRRKADQTTQKRILDKRQDELRAQAEAAEKSAAVHRALLDLKTLRTSAAETRKGEKP